MGTQPRITSVAGRDAYGKPVMLVDTIKPENRGSYGIASKDWRLKAPPHDAMALEVRTRADNGDELAMLALRSCMAFNLGVPHGHGAVRRLTGNDYEDARERNRWKNSFRQTGHVPP